MSPRPYQLGKRQETSDETRDKVLAAARALLMAPGGYGRFTIDAVAREAGVRRYRRRPGGQGSGTGSAMACTSVSKSRSERARSILKVTPSSPTSTHFSGGKQ